MKAVVCLCLLLAIATVARATPPTSRVTVAISQCATHFDEKPELLISAGPNRAFRRAGEFLQTRMQGHVRYYVADLQQNTYSFVARTKSCTAPSAPDVTVITGHDRFVPIVLLAKQIAVLSPSWPGALAVVSDFSLSMGIEDFSAAPRTRTPTWDGNVAYFNGLKPGEYMLAMEVSGAYLCRRVTIASTEEPVVIQTSAAQLLESLQAKAVVGGPNPCREAANGAR